MTTIYKCADCACITDSPYEITEEEILETMEGVSFEEMEHALESVGVETCPECFSPALEILDVI